jgi:hypothetical protein
MQSVVDFADQPYLEVKRGEDVCQKLWAARNLPVLDSHLGCQTCSLESLTRLAEQREKRNKKS